MAGVSDPLHASDAIEPDMRAHIGAKLEAAAIEHGVRILYAAESGSRAWGFASSDSDYDVRFIYAHPVDWYLRLGDGRDVIEYGIDERLTDFNGWDVRKALRLLLKSNPVLYEWLVSPIVYADDGTFRPAARALFERHASPAALAHHYWSIARGQWHSEIDRREKVKLKKYFYCIRPLLSLAHVAREGSPPPMQLEALVAGSDLEPRLRADIADLLMRKRAAGELGPANRIPSLDAWIVASLERFEPSRLPLASDQPVETRDDADRLFLAAIGR